MIAVSSSRFVATLALVGGVLVSGSLVGCSGASTPTPMPAPVVEPVVEPAMDPSAAATQAPPVASVAAAPKPPERPWYCVGTTLKDTEGNEVTIQPMCFPDQPQCESMASDMKKEESTVSVTPCVAASEVYCHTHEGQRNVCFGTTAGCEEERMAANEGECVVTAAE